MTRSEGLARTVYEMRRDIQKYIEDHKEDYERWLHDYLLRSADRSDRVGHSPVQ